VPNRLSNAIPDNWLNLNVEFNMSFYSLSKALRPSLMILPVRGAIAPASHTIPGLLYKTFAVKGLRK